MIVPAVLNLIIMMAPVWIMFVFILVEELVDMFTE
jgi:hypothetical protein